MSRREFSRAVKAQAFLRASGHCEGCTARLKAGGFHYDHDLPDGLGGEPTLANCRVLCRSCHDVKTHSRDVPQIAKMKRQRDSHIGAKTTKGPGIQSRGFDKAEKKPKRSRRELARMLGVSEFELPPTEGAS